MLVKLRKNKYFNTDYCITMSIKHSPRQVEEPISKEGFNIVAGMINGEEAVIMSFDNQPEAEQKLKQIIRESKE